MKKLITLLVLFATSCAIAQVPQGISYQAIALNASVNPGVNSSVGIRLTILDNNANGTAIYTETQTKTTNAQGLFNLVIGQGTPTSGTFSIINWGTNSKFLKVDIDINGGTNYLNMGTSQLLSVPYAMYAGNTENVSPEALNGLGSESLKGTSFVVLDGSSIKAYYNGVWSTQNFSQQVYSDDVINENGTFIVLDGSSIKSFSKGIWSTQNFANQVYSDDLIISNGSVLVLSNNQIMGFDNGTWSTQTFSQQIYSDDVFYSNGIFLVKDGTSVKAFYNGVWSSQNFSQQIYSDDVSFSNGSFLIRDNTTIKSFYKGLWATQNFTQQIYSDNIIQSVTE